MAIYRNCKYCGAPLSLREMPAGQWVAFDFGTDTVHQCRPTEAQAAGVGAKAYTGTSSKAGARARARTKSAAGSNGNSRAGSKTGSGTGTGARSGGRRSAPTRRVAETSDALVVATEYTAILQLLERAIAERRCVRMRYYTASRQAITDRVVEPTSLIPVPAGNILEAYCRFRSEYRHFAVGNIQRAELLNETFTPRPGASGTVQLSYTGPRASDRSNATVRETLSDNKQTASAAGTGCLLPLLVAVTFLLVVLVA